LDDLPAEKLLIKSFSFIAFTLLDDSISLAICSAEGASFWTEEVEAQENRTNAKTQMMINKLVFFIKIFSTKNQSGFDARIGTLLKPSLSIS
jgi:hypothetical protein